MAEGTLLLVNKACIQMNPSESGSQLDTLIMFHCCRHNLWDRYDKQNHPTKEIHESKGIMWYNLKNIIYTCLNYLMAVLAFITENWKLSTISAAETSRTVQTLIRNGKIIITRILSRCMELTSFSAANEYCPALQACGGSELFAQLKPAGHGSHNDTCKHAGINVLLKMYL